MGRSRSVGKGSRRQGREMALQMLYQWDSVETHPSEILRSFDLPLYRAESAGLTTVDESSERSVEEESLERQVRASYGDKVRSRAFQFAQSLFLGVLEEVEDLDRRIAEQAVNWRVERMSRVDRNILRLALFEAHTDVELPPAVVIDEAIELAKKFGSENSGAFVNGILDGVLRTRSTAK